MIDARGPPHQVTRTHLNDAIPRGKRAASRTHDVELGLGMKVPRPAILGREAPDLPAPKPLHWEWLIKRFHVPGTNIAHFPTPCEDARDARW